MVGKNVAELGKSCPKTDPGIWSSALATKYWYSAVAPAF
jgi:hypothetical protein